MDLILINGSLILLPPSDVRCNKHEHTVISRGFNFDLFVLISAHSALGVMRT